MGRTREEGRRGCIQFVHVSDRHILEFEATAQNDDKKMLVCLIHGLGIDREALKTRMSGWPRGDGGIDLIGVNVHDGGPAHDKLLQSEGGGQVRRTHTSNRSLCQCCRVEGVLELDAGVVQRTSSEAPHCSGSE